MNISRAIVPCNVMVVRVRLSKSLELGKNVK